MNDDKLIKELKGHYAGEYAVNGFEVMLTFRFDRRDESYKAIKEIMSNGKDTN